MLHSTSGEKEAGVNPVVRGALGIVGFLVGFAACGGALSLLVPPPRVDIISPKLDWLAAHPTRFDVLVVGSSRMRQVIPEILDAEMKAAGLSIDTFNLCADGMRPPEDGYVLEQALTTRKAPLRFVMMEANRIALRIDDEDEETSRMVYWHDNRRMLTLCRRAFSHSIVDPPNAGKWISDTWRNVRHTGGHAHYWIQNSVRAGHGSEMLLTNWLGLPPSEQVVWRGLGAEMDGYVPPDDTTPMNPEELRGYERSLAKLRKGRLPGPMEQASQDEIERSRKLAQAHGARLILVSPPGTNVEIFQPLLPPGSDVIYLDFSDPAKYPELFEARVHINGAHLTFEGSQIFTRLIARELAAHLRAEEAKK